MEKAMCLNKNRELKLCPFRICQVENPPALRGNGTVVTEQFYQCLGEECVAYHVGICLRLSNQVDNLYKRKEKL